MVKALLFKGDKKPNKKRKRAAATGNEDDAENEASTSKALTTTTSSAAETDEDDSWVSAELASDLTGPVIFVLPTDTPSCLACDALGKVFSVSVENIVDANPATAEPHDVRQVWIANKIVGTELFSFKGHHGKYLGVDKFGVLSASREAISPEEQFTCIPMSNNPGTFGIQTQRDKFIVIDPEATATDKTVRGDSEDLNYNSTLRIRMQARFKPKLKVAKETAAREKISRKELEALVGRRLDDDDVKILKRARRDGNFHEKLLDVKVKGKHDKFA
ncbi:FRG1-like family protein [Tothia fuscella]|uniref:FRG1-like family protein n=1 Tax=Tothia fuscella TaxID=1048955 RepID=A0A9P4U4F2_9PEZI|nr:FRG1-like family protein [Tothia fuscella]